MDITIDGFHCDNNELYKKPIDLPERIFVTELWYSEFLEFDGKDNKAMHYIILVDGIEAGCARWIENSEFLKIDRFGVEKNFRSIGLGLLLNKFIKRDLTGSKKVIELLSTDETTMPSKFWHTREWL